VKLHEIDDGWTVEFDRGQVQRIELDFRLGILFSDSSSSASLHIGQECSLRTKSANRPVVPEVPSTVAAILPYSSAKIIGLMVWRDGQLALEFANGDRLEVCPNDKYEAWELGCSDGFRLICNPGGGVSVFSQ
jgi:hypothetical protein